MTQPNILLIHTDQHRFDAVGANGHPQLRTPNLDRLAAEGVNYTHAFTPAPICSPARASLLTGTWSFTHGCLSIPMTVHYRPARAELPLVTQLLHGAGYRQGHVGKYHQEAVAPPDECGVDVFINGKQYEGWREEQGLPPVPQDNGFFGEVDPHITPEQSRLAWGVDHVIEVMRRFREEGRPFFIRWDPVEPHLPCRPPEPYASMYPPESITPWPSFHDGLEGKPFIQAQQRRTWEVEGWTWEQWAPIVSRYLGEISLIDAQVGRLLAALEQLDAAEQTLVVYTSDHGDFCGGHGMIDKHYNMYEDVVRVPLLARMPGVLPAGTTCDAFLSNEIDLATTLLETAGVEPPPSFEGRSILAAARGEDPQPREDIFSAWHGAQFGLFTQRMVRDRRWKYVWNATAEDELYDLERDPGELRNLARSLEAAEELARLRRRLVDWMEQTRDPLLNQWTRRALLAGLKV